MTTEQIKYVLEKNNYSLDQWTDLSRFPTVFLDQDSCVFTDSKTVRVKFNSTTKILEVSYGLTKNGIFTSNYGETDNYTPNFRITFDDVAGFTQTSGIYIANYKNKK